MGIIKFTFFVFIGIFLYKQLNTVCDVNGVVKDVAGVITDATKT